MKIILTAMLGLVISVSTAAQERTLTEAEFGEMHSKVQADLYRGQHGPYRQIMETEASTEGRPEVTYKLRSVTLTIPDQGSHRVEDRSFGGKPSKYESITLGDRSFSRTDGGEWKAIERKPAASNPPPAPRSPTSQDLDRRVEFKYNGVETYGGRQVHVYTRTEYARRMQASSGSTGESNSVTKVRTSLDGKYYRFEGNSDTLSGRGAAGKTRILIEVEADPTITITPPEAAK